MYSFDPLYPPFADWERRALVELYKEYHYCLRERRIRLRPAALELCDAESFCGKWQQETRTIYLSRKLLQEQSWFSVLAVLRHEMAHQLVDEEEGIVFTDSAHGEAFQKACQRLGVPAEFSKAQIDFKLDALDWREILRDETAEKMLEKVRKLLNLATSSNEHEALLAMNRVHEIYARYNLQHMSADAQSRFVHLVISTGKKRLQTQEQKMVGILVGHFFVQVIVGQTYDVKTGNHYRQIEIIGKRENVLMAEYVYHFLQQQLQCLLESERKRRGKGFSRAAQKSYQLGILQGFDDKLHPELKKEAAAESVISQALQVFQKDPSLKKYIAQIYPRLTSLTSQARLRDPSAYADGKKAGREMTLNKPIRSAAQGVIKFLQGL